LIGVGPERPELPPLVAFVGREQAVLGSFGMDRPDIEDLYGEIASEQWTRHNRIDVKQNRRVSSRGSPRAVCT